MVRRTYSNYAWTELLTRSSEVFATLGVDIVNIVDYLPRPRKSLISSVFARWEYLQLYTTSLGLVTEISIALIGQQGCMPIEALVERLGCGVHVKCVVRAWVWR